MPSVRHKRGTLAQIDAAATASQLKSGEVYLVTDEDRLTVATATNAHEPVAKASEVGGSTSGVHARGPRPGVGGYVSASLVAGTLGTVAGAANRLDFYPFIPDGNITIDELAIEVTTLIAASQARVGIYSANGGSLPNALLTGQGTLLDCATTGAKASAITALVLTSGTTYWLAIHTSSTQTLRSIAAGALLPLGHAATGTAIYSCRRATATFASGLPTTAPAATLTSAAVPWIRMRQSA
jgi:hypothetical protein